MKIEELRSTQSELMIQHAEVGCALIDKDLPAEAADWINEGVSIATKMNDDTARQLMTIENTDKIIQNLSIMDSALLEGAVDLKKISENSDKLKESVHRNHTTWRIVLKAIAAALELNIETKPVEPVVEETKSDLPKLQPSFPKMLPELSKRLSAIRESDRQIIIPGFPLEQFKITKSGDIIDRTVDRAVKPTLRNGVPELFQARNAATGKIETVSINDIKIPEGYSVTVPKTTNKADEPIGIWVPLNMNKLLNMGKLPEDRYVYNKASGEIVDRRTGLKVTKRSYKDGAKYLFDIDGKLAYVRCSHVEALFNEPEKPEEASKEPPKEQAQVPPRKILIEYKPLDWLGPLIDTHRYLIFSDGRIQDTKAGKPVFPVNSCQVVLEAIDGSKGTWNIHELVWSAFHPDDRNKIRVSGGVFKINGHADDNRLTNLVFKPNTTQVVNSLTNLPTQTTNMTGGKQEEPKLDESVKVESRLIDWIAGIDPSKYSISRDGKIVNNHAGGKEIVSKMHAGKRVVKLQGKKGKNATYTVADLVNRAYPNQPHAVRSSGKFRIEDVTKPLDAIASKEPSEKVIPVDWIDGIPSTKYIVSEQGYVLNTISGKRIIPNASGTINMSDSIDKGSRKLRIHMKMESLIWKAFHAEDRQLEKVYLEHIDGDASNCAIENLRKKIVDKKR